MTIRGKIALAAAGFFLFLGCFSNAWADGACDDQTTVFVNGNPAVCGKAEDGVYTYRGIPYATTDDPQGSVLPPFDVDSQPVPWPSTMLEERTEFGPFCLQPGASFEPVGDLDCLELNIWTPADAINGGRSLPVMLFIHGGAFIEGRGSTPIYDGAALAAQGVVVVTINYRLGPLGFLSANHVNGTPVSIGGNYALHDQQTAMAWVSNNIAPFGGDPAQITIFGESAGAESVGLHTLSVPSSEPYFRAAIMESNPLGILYATPDEAAVKSGNIFLNQLCSIVYAPDDCPDMPDLSRLANPTPKQIIDAEAATLLLFAVKLFGSINDLLPISLPFAPVLDGDLVTQQPFEGQAGKPIVFGTNRDEGASFIAALYPYVKSTLFTPAGYQIVFDRQLSAPVPPHHLGRPL